MKQSSWRNVGSAVSGDYMFDVLEQAKLNYTVVKENAFAYSINGGKVKIPGSFVTRISNQDVFFGTVGSKYEIVQNIDAFDFVDNLVASGLTYEKAGMAKNGMVYVIASLPEYNLFGDGMKPYVIFQNSHNGSTPVKAAITTLRLVCENQFNVAFKRAGNTVVIRHTRNAKDKLAEAQRVMQHITGYSDQFSSMAEELSKIKISTARAEKVAALLFPAKEDDSNIKKQRAEENRQQLLSIYKGDADLQNLRGNGWGLLNAYADFATHAEPKRKTENWEENKFLTLSVYRPIDSIIELIRAVA